MDGSVDTEMLNVAPGEFRSANRSVGPNVNDRWNITDRTCNANAKTALARGVAAEVPP